MKTSTLIFTLIFAVLSILAILYFSEVNRSILLFVIYPVTFFGFLGICSIYEKQL